MLLGVSCPVTIIIVIIIITIIIVTTKNVEITVTLS